MNSMKKNREKRKKKKYEFTDWESGDSVYRTHIAHPNVFDQYSILWLSRARACEWARMMRRAVGMSGAHTIHRLSYLCTRRVHEIIWAKRIDSSRRNSIQCKKEKDNIKIDDFNSVSIALPDSKLVDIVVFFFIRSRIFVCDINAHRDFSSASTFSFVFFFRPLLLVLTLVTRFVPTIFFSHSALFSNNFLSPFVSFGFRFDWH